MGRLNAGAAKAALAGCCALAFPVLGGSASAAPVFTTVNADISATPYTFGFLGGTFTFDGSGGFPNYLSVATQGGAAVRTVFGGPSTDFTNRGTVVYDQNTLGGFGSFPTLTTVPYTNGENFLGLRVTSGGQDFYGFAFTTNSTFNGFAFETLPGVSITATTAFPAGAIPEPGTWALLILGFGAVGAGLRRKSASTRLAHA